MTPSLSPNPCPQAYTRLWCCPNRGSTTATPDLATKTYLLVDLKVSAGEHEGQRIFCRFNLYHPNPKAQQYSWHLLRQLATALGQDVSSGEVDPDKFDGGKCKVWIEAGQHEKYGLQLDAKKFYE